MARPPPLPRYAVGLPGAGDRLSGGIGSNQCICLPGAFTVGASPSVPNPAVVGLLYVHGRILPLLDPNRDGRNFLGTVQHLVPEKTTLFATGGPQVLRYSFYVKRPLISLWDPPAIARQTDGAGPFYVLAKASSQEALEILGRPRQIASSLSSAGECPPKYCIALFRIDPPESQ